MMNKIKIHFTIINNCFICDANSCLFSGRSKTSRDFDYNREHCNGTG